jgi:hypothetical protein
MIELREMHEPDLKELHAKLILKEEREPKPDLKKELNMYLIPKEGLNAKLILKEERVPDPDLKKESNIYLIPKRIKRETDFERRTRT